MLEARQIFGTCCALMLFAVGLTSESTAQTSAAVNYAISDGGVRYNESYPTQTSSFATTSPGCSIYGSCASSGYQSSNACNQANCGCTSANCGIRGSFEQLRMKELEYFQYPPAPSCPGDRLHQLIGAQKANGRLAQLVFYNFHFGFDPASGTWALSPAGVNNVYKIARIWPSTPGTIVVEPGGDANGDQIRLQIVQQSLAASGIQADVALGRSTAFGMSGVDAVNIYEQRILNAPLASPSRSSQSIGAASGGN